MLSDDDLQEYYEMLDKKRLENTKHPSTLLQRQIKLIELFIRLEKLLWERLLK